MKDFINVLDKGGENLFSGDFSVFSPQSGEVLFVDGGNSELVGGPGFSIQFIRVAGVAFKGREKAFCQVSEFYALFYTVRENEKMVVKTRIMPVKGGKLLDENSLVFHFAQANLNAFADVTRRVAEISMACTLSRELQQNASVVLDGSLETRFDVEKKFLDRLKEIAQNRKINLCALSKSTTLINNHGESLPFLAKKKSPEGRWNSKIAETEFQTHLINLHPEAKAVLRCDAMPCAVPEIFSYLAFTSNDPIFLGYPYGLIEADKMARVSNREKEVLRTELSARLGNKWVDLEEREISLKAHKILDNIL